MPRELYLKNINRWVLYSPYEAKKMLDHRCQSLEICETAPGEMNLKRVEDGKAEYFHKPGAAMEEARAWFASLSLSRVKTIFVYGVGLGYYYQAAKAWLKENRKRDLVFLEDDLEVIHCLFETEQGSELLHSDQVRLYSVDPVLERYADSFERLPGGYFLTPFTVSALNVYREKNSRNFSLYEQLLYALKDEKSCEEMEKLMLGKDFFYNFYRNMLELPNSKLGNHLFGKFKGVPAIICGAGPSLEKKIPLLEKLKDQALIFAGGIALNALNEGGVLPHFAVMDPRYQKQSASLLMNQAYQVPYFYQNGIQPESLIHQQGERLYLAGGNSFGLGQLVEERLGMEGFNFEAGNDTLLQSICIAHSLGCNPIILLGVDLAASQGKLYSKGNLPHPLLEWDSDKVDLRTKPISNSPLVTTDQWMSTRSAVVEFSNQHPDVQLINATGGGVAIPQILHLNFEDIERRFFVNTEDLAGRQHALTQLSVFPESMTEQKIIFELRRLIKELEELIDVCNHLKEEFQKTLHEDSLVPKGAMAYLKKLNEAPLYAALLSRFNDAFLSFIGAQGVEALLDDKGKIIDQEEANQRRKEISLRRFSFLSAVCQRNIQHINDVMEGFQLRKQIMSANAYFRKAAEGAVPCYSIEKGHYQIEDKELDLVFDEAFTSEFKETGDQEIRIAFYVFKGRLHGPYRVFSSLGLLAESWYVYGVKQGRTRYFYPEGSLYSLQRFKDGIWNGKQEFYYPSGSLKSLLSYREGRIDGNVDLYFPNGVLKRRLSFVNGKRNGPEQIFNIGGMLESEVNYWQDQPIGSARSWYLNGQLAKEIVYKGPGEPEIKRLWTHEGILLADEFITGRDYLVQATQQTERLSDSIKLVYQQLDALPHTNELDSEIEELQAQMQKLQGFQKTMENLSKGTEEQTNKALWKTAKVGDTVRKELEEATKTMANDIKLIEDSLKILAELMKKSSQEGS